MLTLDSLELDVKRALVTSADHQMQWKKLREELLKKNTRYADDTFTSILNRKLQKMEDVKKKSLGHKRVFYFIPKKKLKKVREELNREVAHRAFDDIWNGLSPEQRKRELKNLLRKDQTPVVILNKVKRDLAVFAKEQIDLIIPRLQNPTNETKKRIPEDERRQILLQTKKDLNMINSFSENQDLLIDEEKAKKITGLMNEFMALVVEPDYSGDFRAAINDLIEIEVKKKKSKSDGNE